jgi:hypothetical protein
MVQRLKILIGSYCFLAFLLSAHVCTAQFTDNFSDGNFTASPVWGGSTTDFIVNGSAQLQLNNSVASTSKLSASHAVSSIDNFEWQVYVRQSFAPSGSNFGRVYLVSDQPDLEGPLNGYYLQFGEALSSDAVELFKQTGLTSTSVCRATDGAIATTVNLRVRVLRSNTGLWQLLIDYTGGTNFVLETSGTDATFTTSAFLGVFCVYTSSNATRFYYDDFYMGPEILDTTPPSIVSVDVLSSTELNVVFNENVEGTSSQLVSNYSVDNSVGNPIAADLQLDGKTVHLTFAQFLPNGVNCILSVSGVMDLRNNPITIENGNFLFFQAIAKDIIINEIFADPSPSVGLPEIEFVEIYNRSNKIIDLLNWKITDGATTGLIPSHLIFPGEHVILTYASTAAQFNSFGTVLPVSNFPTLNNTGDALVLIDNTDIIIDNVIYSDAWYRDDDKKQGGFTLELIDSANPCGEDDNWTASEAGNGGTPGTQNAVFANKPDVTGPKLVSAIPTSETELVLTFNEKLDNQLPSLTDFIITPSNSISQISFIDSSLKLLRLTLSTSLQSGTVYSIEAQNIYDCNQNSINTDFDVAVFGLPQQAVSSDIVINEVLFNPRPTGVDFVEVYNNSEKFINLKNWTVANYENGVILNSKIITVEDFLLAPDQYVVFTKDKNIVKGEYISSVEENLFWVADLPTLNNDKGTLALIDQQNHVIDFLNYADDYHSIFINDDEGVSLERISFTVATNDRANWKSASSTVGFATPGYINSNVRDEQTFGKITISPEVFEPVIGQPSFTQIHYNFEQGGYVVNVKILDFQGREIKQLANNATLGTEGFFRWDGDTDAGAKARTGYYVVWVEVFNANGQLNTFRKRVVVASKF